MARSERSAARRHGYTLELRTTDAGAGSAVQARSNGGVGGTKPRSCSGGRRTPRSETAFESCLDIEITRQGCHVKRSIRLKKINTFKKEKGEGKKGRN